MRWTGYARAVDDVLLIVGSDHGHETVSGVVDIEAELIAAGIKAGRGLERHDRGCRAATRA